MEAYTEIFAWGANHCGQLGLQAKDKVSKPVCCSFNIRIKEISCGSEHSVFVSYSGLTYSMGSNKDGRLGISDRSIKFSVSPCLIETLASVKISSVSSGGGHSIAISSSGKAYSWGEGEFGALGTGSISTCWKPRLIPLDMKVQSSSCGARHTAFLVQGGLLYVCGAGESGQLGTGRRERELLPVSVSISNVKQVACGVFHTLILTHSGAVYATGGNSFGQLGTGNTQSFSNPVKISHLDGIFVEKVACASHSACLTEMGDLYVWGASTMGEYLLPHKVAIPGIRQIALGGGFGIAIDTNGVVYSWGSNSKGELGQAHTFKSDSVNIINALNGKTTQAVACGVNFCICLGEDIIGANSHRIHTEQTVAKKKKNLDTRVRASSRKRKSIEKKMNKTFTPNQISVFPGWEEDLQSENFKLKSILQENQFTSNKERQRLCSQYEKEISTLKISLEDSQRKQIALSEDLYRKTEETHALQQDLARTNDQVSQRTKHVTDLEHKTQTLEQEISHLQQTISDLNSHIDAKSRLSTELEERIQILETNNDRLRCDLQIQIDHSMKLKAEINHLNCQLSENAVCISKLSSGNDQWERSCNALDEENRILRENARELEVKNKDLLLRIDREMQLRAEEYKNKTNSLLSRTVHSVTTDRRNYESPSKSENKTLEIITRIDRKRYESPSNFVKTPARATPKMHEIKAQISRLMDRHAENESLLSQS